MIHRGDRHRILRWLWTGQSLVARTARVPLIPFSILWWLVMAIRNWVYRKGYLPTYDLALPTISVGNLSVGGSGKTPITDWIALQLLAMDTPPAILLRGVGGDEELVHRETVPGAIVLSGADRVASARGAIAQGARVIILDDAYQRIDVKRDLNILLLSADAAKAVPWNLPAGPWRESWRAIRRADLIIVTRKRAPTEIAENLVAKVSKFTEVPVARAELKVSQFSGLLSDRIHHAGVLRNRRVIAAAGIADPEAFIAQIKATGAQVQTAIWRDHHRYSPADIEWLAAAARKVDFLVLTAKDAVKIRPFWPPHAPEPLVAQLDITWESGREEVLNLLGRFAIAGVNL